MKKLLLIFCLLPSLLFGQPAPTFEASDAQTTAMTVGAPFYVSPRRLADITLISTNLALGTLTNMLLNTSNGAASLATNAIIGYFPGITNAVASTNNPPIAGLFASFTGTNAAGMAVIHGTANGAVLTNLLNSATVSAGANVTVTPTQNPNGSTNYAIASTGGGGGGGIVLPPNAVGVLTNDGSGNTNWSSGFTGAWVAAGTLPKTAADTSWMPLTNAVAYSNATGLPIAGSFLSVIGTNTFGAIMTKPTFDAVGITNVNVFDTLSPTFSGTGFGLGTNSAITCSSNIYFITILNTPAAGIERYGQVTIAASGGNVTVTNPPLAANWGASDGLLTRVITNGNTGVCALQVKTGVGGYTNFAFAQFWTP